ncbi:hypothetical protein [Sandaracinus amylolyticus]|uniref:Lipoprotein n=1 Tax=Sandaracinus amylolyticus TaxID=927083 RepID=A0A0F6YF14_9BACT|nr:hypothetical protein [Sandaracinus amylolyticus]AKF03063.1 hypothetical protein DB32_000212 [Sandaracinus amylolyticus]
MRRVVIALGIVLTGCAGAWEPRRYLADSAGDTCSAWDLECSRAAHGTYGCGPSGCGTPVRQPTRTAK